MMDLMDGRVLEEVNVRKPGEAGIKQLYPLGLGTMAMIMAM